MDSGAATDTLNASKAVYCVAAPPEGGGVRLVAFGGAERVLRLWDPRAGPGEALVRLLKFCLVASAHVCVCLRLWGRHSCACCPGPSCLCSVCKSNML